jgi:hypothetical protein
MTPEERARQAYNEHEDDTMPVGQDPRKTHFRISVTKSVARIAACIILGLYGIQIDANAVWVFASLMGFAEVLGIIEEL